MQILVIHGWRVRDGGDRTIGGLAGQLSELGHNVTRLRYGYTLDYWSTRHRSAKAARRWAANIDGDVAVVGHSNGGRIALEISHLAAVRWLALLNPALDSDARPGRGTERCWVYHSRRDLATWLARHVPWSTWGAMGNTGYRPSQLDAGIADPRMVNLDVTDPRQVPYAQSYGHSWFVDVPAELALDIHRRLPKEAIG